MLRTRISGCVAVCMVVLATSQAYAQRANENALASAQDAFGTTVGNETIGLYTARDVRGFDPVQAGNVRLEGLYFDRQNPNPNEIFVSSMVSGSTVRVGLSAQSYLFPAPTGIADVHLRLPGDKKVVSVVANLGPYEKMSLEVNSETPLSDSFGLYVGGGYIRDDTSEASTLDHFLMAASARWRPSDSIEILPFWGRKISDGMNPRPNVYTAGPFIPPKIPRHVFFSQPWAQALVDDSNFGTFVNASLSDNWSLRSGIFRSLVLRKRFFSNLFQNTQPNGSADNVMVKFPSQSFGSYSGEVRLSGVYVTGNWRHTFHTALRGRYVERNFGGSDTRALGTVVIGVPHFVPEPAFTLHALNQDRVRQGTGGVAYEGLWSGVGELSVGLQKTAYHRSLTTPTAPAHVTEDSPWLPNATLALYATHKLTFFGSYTRGLEESGEATNNATNRGEALPAIRTTQIDAGARWAIAPGISAVVTAFEIKKPYLSLNNVNLFTQVGAVRHRGVEISVAGEVMEGVRIVAGSVFLEASISGDLVDQGRIGRVPIGRTPRFMRFDVDYAPKSWNGLSLDMQIDNRSSRVGTADNGGRIPARTLLNLGGRYKFKLADTPASVRFQVRNVMDTFDWDINVTQLSFVTEEQRRFMLTLAVDF